MVMRFLTWSSSMHCLWSTYVFWTAVHFSKTIWKFHLVFFNFLCQLQMFYLNFMFFWFSVFVCHKSQLYLLYIYGIFSSTAVYIYNFVKYCEELTEPNCVYILWNKIFVFLGLQLQKNRQDVDQKSLVICCAIYPVIKLGREIRHQTEM